MMIVSHLLTYFLCMSDGWASWAIYSTFVLSLIPLLPSIVHTMVLTCCGFGELPTYICIASCIKSEARPDHVAVSVSQGLDDVPIEALDAT